MKKIVSLMAGAAAVALSAAPALAGPDIYQGSATGSLNIPAIPILLPNGINLSGTSTNTALVDAIDSLVNPGVTSSIALFTIDSNGFANNQGTANSQNQGATFSLIGNVTPDCAYYVGNASKTIDFGQIGINANDNNPGAAFDMVGNAPSVDIDTNLAGCNTRNRVTINKANLKNGGAAGLGFDGAQFTDELQFTATARYTAGAVNSTAAVNGAANHIVVGAGATTASAQHGAWKSAMNIRLEVQNPGKSLVAGTYNGAVQLDISAY